MLSNSLVAGALASCYILIVFLDLNRTLPANPVRLGPLVTTVGLFYALHLTVISYLVLVVRQILARELFSPAWISVNVLTWLGAAAALAGAALTWTNLRTFSLVLDHDTAGLMAANTAILLTAAGVFVLVKSLRMHFGPRGRRILALLLVLTAAGSVAAPLALRAWSAPLPVDSHAVEIGTEIAALEPSARVTIVAVDAGSLNFIVGATAEGRLPNFGRILDSGAVVDMATVHPTSADAVWAAVSTGKLPQKNGVRSGAVYRLAGGDALQLLPTHCFAQALVRSGFVTEEHHTSAALRARPLWSILGGLGIPVGFVAWPLTYPAPPVRGYLVSDRYVELAATPSDLNDPLALYPVDLQAETLSLLETVASESAVSTSPAATDPLLVRQETAARVDRTYDRIARALAATRPAQVTALRFQSLDPIGHYFLRYAPPLEFGDATQEERRRFGLVLEQQYAVIDEALGRALNALGPDDLLLVVSGYGMEPLSLAARLLERVVGDPELSGTHDAAPDGFLMAYGTAVAKGRSVVRGSVVDVVPTVLYFLGLPIGRDMDGYARTDLFRRSFTDERPITFVPTYDR
jgi:predicted AlkP superfamily phosphohydrolase/phosphomutase